MSMENVLSTFRVLPNIENVRGLAALLPSPLLNINILTW
jgi:hypothetical protein